MRDQGIKPCSVYILAPPAILCVLMEGSGIPPRTAGSPAQWSRLRRLQSVELWQLCVLSGRLRWPGAVLELRALPPERESRGHVGLTARAAAQMGLQTEGNHGPSILPFSPPPPSPSLTGRPTAPVPGRPEWGTADNSVFFILFSRSHLPKCTQNLPLFFPSEFLFTFWRVNVQWDIGVRRGLSDLSLEHNTQCSSVHEPS